MTGDDARKDAKKMGLRVDANTEFSGLINSGTWLAIRLTDKGFDTVQCTVMGAQLGMLIGEGANAWDAAASIFQEAKKTAASWRKPNPESVEDAIDQMYSSPHVSTYTPITKKGDQ